MNNTAFPAVTLKPDAEERRQIKKRYSLTALIIIINTVIFNAFGYGIPIIACMILGGGFGYDAYRAGAEVIHDHELLVTILSIFPPILSETISIILGAKLLKINLLKLSANRDGYSGGTVVKLIILTSGLQFVMSMAAAVIQLALDKIGLKGATVDLSPTTALSANLLTVFYACLLGPVLEELLYRGVILQSMRKYNERFAIILSALIFGLMHQNYQQFIVAFSIGIPMAIVTIKYNSVIPSIFAHIFLNTSAMVQTYLFQYLIPGFYDNASSESLFLDVSSLSSSAMAAMIATAIIRYGILIAAIVVGIISLVKGGNTKIPTPAGKSRALPVFVTVPLWWVIFAMYAFLTFVMPFMR